MKSASTSGSTFDFYGAVMGFDDLSGDSKSEAGAAGTVPPAHDAAVVAGQALAKRLCGQRVPLTF